MPPESLAPLVSADAVFQNQVAAIDPDLDTVTEKSHDPVPWRNA